jgi:Bacterial Ig-like domain (group 1)
MQTMTTLMRFFYLLAVLTLTACSGGGGSSGACQFSCGTGGNPPPSIDVADLDVQINPGTIVNTSTATATATITALDGNRKAVSGAAIILSVDSGVVTPLLSTGTGGTSAASPVTDANGKLVATVSLGSNLALRKITLTAESGTIKRSNTLQVVDGPASAKPTSIELIASANEVGTGGEGVVIRAFVKDANNNALPSTPLSFSTSTGTLNLVSAATDSGGAGSATLSSGSDKANREATVTVTSGTVSSALKLPIRGTKLTLSGPSSLILGNTAVFDVVVTDSKANVVPNVAVTGTSSLSNAVVAGAPRTDSAGQVRFTYTANNPGNDSLVFSGAGVAVSPNPALAVSGQDFTFLSPNASTAVAVNAAQVVQVRFRSAGVPQAGKQINFAATGGTLSTSSATTDAAGLASISLTSTSAGPITVQATVAGSATSATLPLVIVATTPSKLVLQASPTAVPPNLGGSTTNQSQLLAKVTDAASNPVQGVTVNFTRVADPSGGNLLQASAVTDASGQALVAFQAGAQSTANNGVVISATVANAPTVSDTTKLTVNQSALFIALGTGNVIANADPQTYSWDWVAYVTDANGIAVNGATLTIKAIPTGYYMGSLSWNGVTWSLTPTSKGGTTYFCRNEDANGNGILDTGEDDNRDGVLWPGNVIAVTPSNVQTANGRAKISLQYAESYAPWIVLRLTASATVAGTESKTSSEFLVAGNSEDFSSQTKPPASVVSPFGTAPTGSVSSGACSLILIPG